VKGVIFDVDGVVWSGGEVYPDVSILTDLRSEGIKIAFLSNNCSISLQRFRERLLEKGVASEGDIFINTHLLAVEFVKRYMPQEGFFVIGCEELKRELAREPMSGVIVGLDREVTYRDFDIALQILLNGGKFIVCNLDPTLPWNGSFKPGAGSCVAFLREASGKDFILLGKPSPFAYSLLKERAPSVEWTMVGDRCDTDGYFAMNSGIPFVHIVRDERKVAHLCPYITKKRIGKLSELKTILLNGER
jgi:4-nitrophenyl phosphatase